VAFSFGFFFGSFSFANAGHFYSPSQLLPPIELASTLPAPLNPLQALMNSVSKHRYSAFVGFMTLTH